MTIAEVLGSILSIALRTDQTQSHSTLRGPYKLPTSGWHIPHVRLGWHIPNIINMTFIFCLYRVDICIMWQRVDICPLSWIWFYQSWPVPMEARSLHIIIPASSHSYAYIGHTWHIRYYIIYLCCMKYIYICTFLNWVTVKSENLKVML